jgi:hypothetical protein
MSTAPRPVFHQVGFGDMDVFRRRRTGYGPRMRPAVATLGALALVGCTHPSQPSTGLGGFEGTITLHSIVADGKERDFKVTARRETLRIDLPVVTAEPKVPGVTLGHAVYEHALNSVRLFFDTTKEYREMDLSKRIAADVKDVQANPPLEKTGIHKVVAGCACDGWSVKEPDGGRTEACLAPGVAYLEIFHVQLGAHGKESSLAREYRVHGTFPLELVDFDAQGKEERRVVVTKIEPGTVDESAFALPDTYKKVDPHFDKAHE